MILLLQFVTQYFETWSKPVNIFKKIERVQHIPILMLPLWTQCCVWGTSYLNDKNFPPKYSHIFPQHWNGGERDWPQNLVELLSRKNIFKKGDPEARMRQKIYDNLSYWLHEAGFSHQFLSNLIAKGFENERLKITDISGAKINLFYIFRRQNSVRKTYSMCCRTLQRVRVTRYHRFSLKFIWFGAIYNALPRVTTKIT